MAIDNYLKEVQKIIFSTDKRGKKTGGSDYKYCNIKRTKSNISKVMIIDVFLSSTHQLGITLEAETQIINTAMKLGTDLH